MPKGADLMSTDNPFRAGGARTIPSSWPTTGQENYEQLLELADKIGAAYAEASQRMNAALADAYQRLAVHGSGLQESLASAQPATMDPSALSERLDDAQEHALAVGEKVADASVAIGLAYLNAFEEAAIAVAKCQEQLGAASNVELVKASTATGAELLRKVTRANAGTLRDMAG
jgi:hypothetical protein